MPRFRHQPSRAYSLKMSKAGKKSQAVQRAKREAAITPDMVQDLAANPPICEGTAIGAFTWHNHRTGKITRWTLLRGDRVNNYRLRSPDGRTSRPHGLAWLLDKMRPVILTK